MVEFAINSTPSASTLRSPFAVVYWSERAIVLPVDKMLRSESVAPAADDLADQVARVVRDTQERMRRAQASQKASYDRRRRDVSFAVGAHVWLSTDHIRMSTSRKLAPKFIGPYRVAERVGELAYRLDLPPSLRMHNVFHVDRLKQYHPGGGDGHQPPPPVLEPPDEDPVYEVERIVAEKGHGRRRKFRVRWLGYGEEEDRWLSLSDLNDAPDVLNAWYQQTNAS